jgi:hypothetical protein
MASVTLAPVPRSASSRLMPVYVQHPSTRGRSTGPVSAGVLTGGSGEHDRQLARADEAGGGVGGAGGSRCDQARAGEGGRVSSIPAAVARPRPPLTAWHRAATAAQCHMGAPLMMLFDDKSRETWTAPIGRAGLNGFGWVSERNGRPRST